MIWNYQVEIRVTQQIQNVRDGNLSFWAITIHTIPRNECLGWMEALLWHLLNGCHPIFQSLLLVWQAVQKASAQFIQTSELQDLSFVEICWESSDRFILQVGICWYQLDIDIIVLMLGWLSSKLLVSWCSVPNAVLVFCFCYSTSSSRCLIRLHCTPWHCTFGNAMQSSSAYRI